MQDFSKEQIALLRLTSASVLGNAFTDETVLDGVDFEKLQDEALAQTVHLSVFESLSPYKGRMAEETYRKWLKRASRAVQGNLALCRAQNDLARLLEKEGIPYAVIKGTSAAAYYPKPDLRALGDVDFLVLPEDLPRATAALEQAGYRKGEDGHDCHVLFRFNGVRFEMHFETSGIPYGETGEIIRTFLQDTPLQAIPRDGGMVPDPVRHGLILLLHMQHHMLGEGLGLRHLCDWACFVAGAEQDELWQETLLPFLQEIGLYRYAQVMTKTCHNYLNIPCPVWAQSVENEVCREVMWDVLQGGNFGNKDEIRSKSGMLVSRHGKNGTRDGAGKNLFSVLHTSVLKKHPVVKKFPPLYPFFFVWRGIRYATLMLFGKRKSVVKMLPEAQKRRSVYEKLHIFERENSKE